jgi:UrcA family protein
MGRFITTGTAAPPAKIALLVLGSLAGVIAAGAASANPDSDVPSIVVKYSDQSLASDAGVTDLYRRITAAARKVCPTASIRDLVGIRLSEQCRDQAVARAIHKVDNSRLAALYATRSKNG